MPCLPRQRIKGFESRSEQDDSYICGSICDAERESMDTAAWARNVGQLFRGQVTHLAQGYTTLAETLRGRSS